MAKSNYKKSPLFLGLILSILLHSTLIIIILFRGFNSPASIRKPNIISGRIITLDNTRNSGTKGSSSDVKKSHKQIQSSSKPKIEKVAEPKPQKPPQKTKPVEKPKPKEKPKPEQEIVKQETAKKDIVDLSENKKPKAEPKKEPEKKKREDPKPLKPVVKKEDIEKNRQEFLNELKNKKAKEDILSELKRSTENKQFAKANTDSYDITAPKGDGITSAGNNSVINNLYADAVGLEIQSNWNIPPSIPTDGSLITKVFFRSNENGEVLDLRIKESSGNRSFDEFCLRAIKKASPLRTAPPPEILGDVKTDGIVVSFKNDPSY